MSASSKINISNNQIMLFLSLWAVFTQVKDVISAWAVSKANQSAVNEKVLKLDQASQSFSSDIARLTKDVEGIRGDIKAEVNRSYSEDTNHQKMLDLLSSSLKQKQQQQAQQEIQ